MSGPESTPGVAVSLMLLVLLAAPVGAQRPGPVDALQRQHALALLALGELYEKEGLLDDAKRLTLEARDLHPEGAEQPEIGARIAAVEVARKRTHDREVRERRRPFIESEAYETVRGRIRSRREALDRRTIDATWRLSDLALRGERPEEGLEALRLALRIDPDPRRRPPSALRRVWRAVREEQAAAGLPRLEVGTTLSARPVARQDLAGRVVVWRSASL